ncbi:MAG: hypothetical protein H6959_03240 [Chromatiaceae bacterium]|nr:hypothetical protein [Gammaproteobacteria bacterium]MCP5301323.1 hypothetical protein [Chromatiaceae bacterium]MCP5421911.1 hypothetical protein [Chromatiaceae bacterium]
MPYRHIQLQNRAIRDIERLAELARVAFAGMCVEPAPAPVPVRTGRRASDSRS